MQARITRVAVAVGALALVTLVLGPVAVGAQNEKDIVDTAVEAGSLTALGRALAAAGLVETLKGPGPYTMFAPTDEAFANLSPATLAALIVDKAKLAEVLSYHVVAGKVMAADVVKLQSARTVQGRSVAITAGPGVKVGVANVVRTDITATNGVIHVIDTVILPW